MDDVEVAGRGRRCRRARRRRHAGPPRRAHAARRAAAGAVAPPAGHGDQHPLDGAAAGAGASRRRSSPAASTPTCGSGSARPSPAPPRAAPMPSATRAASRRPWSARRARHGAAGLARGGAAPPRRARCRPSGSSSARQLVAVDNGPDGVRRDGARPTRPVSARVRRPLPRRRRRRAQPGPRACSASTMHDRDGAHGGVQVVFRARCGPARRPPLRAVRRRRRRGAGPVPARRPGRSLGLRPAAAGRRRACPRPRSTRARRGDPAGRRRRRSRPPRRAHRAVPLPGQLAERFRVGRDLPRRRRRPSDHATRRHRHEHRAAERLRHRLEAGLGAAGLGRRRSAGHLRVRAPRGRRAQPRSAPPTRTAAAGRVLDELAVDLGGRLAHAWLPSTGPGYPRSTSSDPAGRCSPDRGGPGRAGTVAGTGDDPCASMR